MALYKNALMKKQIPLLLNEAPIIVELWSYASITKCSLKYMSLALFVVFKKDVKSLCDWSHISGKN